jgi:hypothetical protein
MQNPEEESSISEDDDEEQEEPRKPVNVIRNVANR